MEELKHLELLLVQIVDQLGWGHTSEWANSHYKSLSDRIYEKTHVLLNPRTLRRIFEVLKDSDYNPHITTKDILAQYMDYKDWDDFRSYAVQQKWIEQEHIIEDFSPTLPKEKQKQKKLIKILAALGVLIVSMLLVYFSGILKKNKPLNLPVINRKGSQHISEQLPATFTFKFNAPVKVEDQIYKYEYNGFKEKKTLIVTDSLIHITYFLPGLYRVSFKNEKNNTLLYKENILIPSKEWTSAVGYSDDDNNHTPLDYSKDIPTRSDGLLHLTLDQVLKYKSFDETQFYYVHYRKSGKRGIQGDAMRFKTRVINNEALGGITCFDNLIYFRCMYKDLRLHFVKKGCHRFVVLKIGDKEFNGSALDLDMFGINITEGAQIECRTHDGNIDILVEGKKIYGLTYKGSLGEVLFIEYMMKGHGAIDYYSLASTTSFAKDSIDF